MSVEQHSLLVAALCLPALAALWFLVGWLRTRHTTGHSIKHHHQHYRILHHVSWIGVLAAVGLAVTGAGITYVLLHHGGAKFDPRKHIPPPRALLRGGGNPSTTTSPDLFQFAPPVVGNQGNTEACGAWALMTAVYMEERMRGEKPPDLAEGHSPWRNDWCATGGVDQPTTMEQQMAALLKCGAEMFSRWSTWGPPDSTDDLYSTPIDAQIHLLFYGASDTAGLRAIQDMLDQRIPVILLWDVHTDGLYANGQQTTLDGGGHVFYHWFVAGQHVGDLTITRNSWGTAWGGWPSHGGGYIGLEPAVTRYHIVGAYYVTLGKPVAAWLPPTPTPRPTPTSSPTATAHPTATTTPAPCQSVRMTLTNNANARAVPRLSAAPLWGATKGQQVTAVCPSQLASTHWLWVQDARGRRGWILRSALRSG